MKTDAVASHYSQALFKVASSKGQLEKHLSELEKVMDLLKTHPQLQQILSNPSVNNQKKKKVLQDLLLGKIDSQILNFLLLLIDKRRLDGLWDISKKYRQLVQKELGILNAHLITAVPIDVKLKEKVKSKLEQLYRKKIEIQESVNPQIIGGMILMVDNQMIDHSIKNRLYRLKQNLLEANI
jgi:F-type H+-transporting ATPase subunit delta